MFRAGGAAHGGARRRHVGKKKKKTAVRHTREDLEAAQRDAQRRAEDFAALDLHIWLRRSVVLPGNVVEGVVELSAERTIPVAAIGVALRGAEASFIAPRSGNEARAEAAADAGDRDGPGLLSSEAERRLAEHRLQALHSGRVFFLDQVLALCGDAAIFRSGVAAATDGALVLAMGAGAGDPTTSAANLTVRRQSRSPSVASTTKLSVHDKQRSAVGRHRLAGSGRARRPSDGPNQPLERRRMRRYSSSARFGGLGDGSVNFDSFGSAGAFNHVWQGAAAPVNFGFRAYEVPAGRWVYPFAFALPVGLPPTVRVARGAAPASDGIISYAVEAFAIPRDARDATLVTAVSFHVLSAMPTPQWLVSVPRSPPLLQFRAGWCCFDFGATAAEVVVQRTVLAADRDEVVAVVSVDNTASTRPVDAIELSVVRRVVVTTADDRVATWAVEVAGVTDSTPQWPARLARDAELDVESPDRSASMKTSSSGVVSPAEAVQATTPLPPDFSGSASVVPDSRCAPHGAVAEAGVASATRSGPSGGVPQEAESEVTLRLSLPPDMPPTIRTRYITISYCLRVRLATRWGPPPGDVGVGARLALSAQHGEGVRAASMRAAAVASATGLSAAEVFVPLTISQCVDPTAKAPAVTSEHALLFSHAPPGVPMYRPPPAPLVTPVPVPTFPTEPTRGGKGVAGGWLRKTPGPNGPDGFPFLCRPLVAVDPPPSALAGANSNRRLLCAQESAAIARRRRWAKREAAAALAAAAKAEAEASQATKLVDLDVLAGAAESVLAAEPDHSGEFSTTLPAFGLANLSPPTSPLVGPTQATMPGSTLVALRSLTADSVSTAPAAPASARAGSASPFSGSPIASPGRSVVDSPRPLRRVRSLRGRNRRLRTVGFASAAELETVVPDGASIHESEVHADAAAPKAPEREETGAVEVLPILDNAAAQLDEMARLLGVDAAEPASIPGAWVGLLASPDGQIENMCPSSKMHEGVPMVAAGEIAESDPAAVDAPVAEGGSHRLPSIDAQAVVSPALSVASGVNLRRFADLSLSGTASKAMPTGTPQRSNARNDCVVAGDSRTSEKQAKVNQMPSVSGNADGVRRPNVLQSPTIAADPAGSASRVLLVDSHADNHISSEETVDAADSVAIDSGARAWSVAEASITGLGEGTSISEEHCRPVAAEKEECQQTHLVTVVVDAECTGVVVGSGLTASVSFLENDIPQIQRVGSHQRNPSSDTAAEMPVGIPDHSASVVGMPEGPCCPGETAAPHDVLRSNLALRVGNFVQCESGPVPCNLSGHPTAVASSASTTGDARPPSLTGSKRNRSSCDEGEECHDESLVVPQFSSPGEADDEVSVPAADSASEKTIETEVPPLDSSRNVDGGVNMHGEATNRSAVLVVGRIVAEDQGELAVLSIVPGPRTLEKQPVVSSATQDCSIRIETSSCQHNFPDCNCHNVGGVGGLSPSGTTVSSRPSIDHQVDLQCFDSVFGNAVPELPDGRKGSASARPCGASEPLGAMARLDAVVGGFHPIEPLVDTGSDEPVESEDWNDPTEWKDDTGEAVQRTEAAPLPPLQSALSGVPPNFGLPTFGRGSPSPHDDCTGRVSAIRRREVALPGTVTPMMDANETVDALLRSGSAKNRSFSSGSLV